MGNYISCTLSIHIPSGSSSSHSKVILPNSEIRNIGKAAAAAAATSAAELMLEFPGHFLVNSRSLRVGRGFHALCADEDLEPAGDIYVMFPMQRLNSLVDAADTAQPLYAAAAAAGKGAVRQRQRRHTSTVTPVVSVSSTGAKEASTTEFMNSRRSSLCRSRRPALEPIAEEET